MEAKRSDEVRPTASGLDGVVVAETALSDVDGERGRLILAGHDVEAYAPRASFEDAYALLVERRAVDEGERSALARRLGEARERAFARLSTMGDALAQADGCDALRAVLGHGVPADGDEGLHLAATVAVAAGAWARTREGKAPLAPDGSLSHAADLLRLVRGTEAPAALVRGLDTYLVTVSDHGMNASTFTARVVASTGSDATSAVSAALGALKGPLHGGAPGPVLDMLDAVGEPANAAPWLEGELAAGRRVMGMGHRVYRVRDPRAAVLEGATTALLDAGVHTPRLALARAVEAAAVGILRQRHPTRPLLANVEFYTAVLLDALGLPRTLFTPTFAVGRVIGWYAHVQEQRRVGRLIRPASRYVGPTPREV